MALGQNKGQWCEATSLEIGKRGNGGIGQINLHVYGVQATYKALSADLFWRQGSRVHFWMGRASRLSSCPGECGILKWADLCSPISSATSQLWDLGIFTSVKGVFPCLQQKKGGSHYPPHRRMKRVIQLEQSSAECLTYYCHSSPCHCHHHSASRINTPVRTWQSSPGTMI